MQCRCDNSLFAQLIETEFKNWTPIWEFTVAGIKYQFTLRILRSFMPYAVCWHNESRTVARSQRESHSLQLGDVCF